MDPIGAFADRQPPPGAELIAVEFSDVRLTAFRMRAPAAARGTVLLLPGYTSSKEEFFPLAPLLAAKGWEVWGCSQRGQADSVAPAGVENYRLSLFADDAIRLAGVVAAHAAHPALHLVGHSFGGVVAAHAALASPGDFSSLTMMSAGAQPLSAPWVVDAMLTAATRGGLARWEENNPTLREVDPALLALDDAFRRARMTATSADHLVGAAATLRTFPDATERLRASPLPIHLIHGEHDDVWPGEQLAELAARIGAHRTVIPAAGHSLPREAPVQTAAAIVTFLAQLDRSEVPRRR